MKKQRQQQTMTPQLNVLSLREQVYDSIGIIETAIVQNCFDKINSPHISRFKFIFPSKHRRDDFQGQNYIPEWELRNCDEQDRYIDVLNQGKPDEADRVLKDIHWSYNAQKTFIKKFFTMSENGG